MSAIKRHSTNDLARTAQAEFVPSASKKRKAQDQNQMRVQEPNTNLNDHQKMLNSKFPCDFCPKVFFTWSHLKDHGRITHKVDYESGDLFQKRLTLNYSAHPSRPFKCTQCEFHFETKQARDGHLKMKHNMDEHGQKIDTKPKETKRFECVQCDQKISPKMGLYLAHLKKMHNIEIECENLTFGDFDGKRQL